MTQHRNHLAEALALVQLSVVMSDRDEELGQAIADAIRDTSAWQRVHDRLNVLGDFAGADKVREAVSRGISAPMPRKES